MGEIRVISGLWRGRRIKVGRERKNGGLRPTADRVRTSLFDRLAPDLRNAHVLDLFAGTGSLGIEALSRGAGDVTFVERAPAVVRLLEENLKKLGAVDYSVRTDEVFRALRGLRRIGETYDLILADPPYESGLAPRLVATLDEDSLLAPAGLMVVEHDRREELPEPASIDRVDERRYGDTILTFYRGK